MKNILAAILFVSIPLAAGSAIGIATAPGEWFAALAKPGFNPPSWVFAPVWSVLYVMIGLAGWLIWRAAPHSIAMKVWIAQMLLNWLWSPVFFTLHAMWAAVVVILTLLALIITFMACARTVDVRASWLFAPYAAWVAFASILNIAIAALN